MRTVRVGDVLEWLAAVLLVAGAYCATGMAWPSMLTAAVCLLYLAQCYANQKVALPKVSWPKGKVK
jgi:hypothetical protein